MYSARLDDALTYAALRHDGQTRKGTGAPYLTHLVHVARILARYGYDEDHEIAGLLHDVLEDTCATPEAAKDVEGQIEARFSREIARAVRALTEPKRDAQGGRLPWARRKRAYLDQLREASELAVRVSAADKIHNLATLLQNLDAQDEAEVWERFRGGPAQTAWFYAEVARVVDDRLVGQPIARELGNLAGVLERRVGGAQAPEGA